MARLWATGFELQTSTVGYEWATGTNGSPAIETSTKRSGNAALRINNTTAAEHITHIFRSAQGKMWARIYIYVVAYPTNTKAIYNFLNSTALKVAVRMSNAGVLQLFNEEDIAQIGSNSSAISLNTWYRLEVFIDDTTLSSTSVEARLYAASDESSLLWNPSGTADFTATPNRFQIGVRSSDATADLIFDDIAINDDTGSYQNSWPGQGELIILRPDGNNGSPQWTRGGTDSGANWSQVEETTPDDVTTYVESNTLDQIDEYTLEATPAAMGSSDAINWVGVGVRFAISSSTGGDPDFVLRLKSGSSVDETGNISGAGSTSYNTNSISDPKNYPALANNSNYEVPGTSTPWTKSTLDSAIVGIRETATDTHFARVSAVWVYVEHKPSPAILAADAGAYTETGVSAGLLQGHKLTANAGSYSESGVTVGLLTGRKIFSDAGSYSLTGVDAGTLKDSILPSTAGSFVETGLDVTLTHGTADVTLTADAGTYSLAGQSASLLRGWEVEGLAGSYSLTGQSANLIRTLLLGADSGSYSLSGQAVNLLKSLLLGADSGSYSLSGQTIGLLRSLLLGADVGSYSLSGLSTGLAKGTALQAGSGTFDLSGIAISLARTYLVNGVAGSFALDGALVGLLLSKVLIGDAGVYTEAGQSASLLRGYKLIPDAGAFSLTGENVNFSGDKTMIASAGSVILTGLSNNLAIGHRLVADAGSIATAGQSVNFLLGKGMIANAASFVLSGQDSVFVRTRLMQAAIGEFVLTGQSIAFSKVLQALAGSLSLSGVSVNLSRSRRLVAAVGSFSMLGKPAGLRFQRFFPAVEPDPSRTGRVTQTLRIGMEGADRTMRVSPFHRQARIKSRLNDGNN